MLLRTYHNDVLTEKDLANRTNQETYQVLTFKCVHSYVSLSLSFSPQVYLKAPMILNGVCVIWRGWIDLHRLDGMGYLEYDDERAQVSHVTQR